MLCRQMDTDNSKKAMLRARAKRGDVQDLVGAILLPLYMGACLRQA